MKTALLGLIAALAISCSGGNGDDPSPTGPTTGVPSAGALEEPTNADWAELGADLAAIAIDGLKEALASTTASIHSPAGPREFATRLFPMPPRSRAFEATYWCCGAFGPDSMSRLSTFGELTTVANNPNRLDIQNQLRSPAPIDWFARGFLWEANLSSGLQLRSTLTASNQQIQPAQTFQLTGSMTYSGKSGSQTPRTAVINLSLQYSNYEAPQPPTATGQMGTVSFTNIALPIRPKPTRGCPCPNGGACDAPPNPGCSIMCK